jgi:hypothetical protein
MPFARHAPASASRGRKPQFGLGRTRDPVLWVHSNAPVTFGPGFFKVPNGVLCRSSFRVLGPASDHQRLGLFVALEQRGVGCPCGLGLLFPAAEQVRSSAPALLVRMTDEPVIRADVEKAVGLAALRAAAKIVVNDDRARKLTREVPLAESVCRQSRKDRPQPYQGLGFKTKSAP